MANYTLYFITSLWETIQYITIELINKGSASIKNFLVRTKMRNILDSNLKNIHWLSIKKD